MELEEISGDYLIRRLEVGKWLATLSSLNPNLNHSPGVTYLIQREKFLKIGFSTNLTDRMRERLR